MTIPTGSGNLWVSETARRAEAPTMVLMVDCAGKQVSFVDLCDFRKKSTHPSDASNTVEDNGEPDPHSPERKSSDHHLTKTSRLSPAREESDGKSSEEVEENGGQAGVGGS